MTIADSSRVIQYRLPKAVELYKRGRSSKILFFGGVMWNESGEPEAFVLKNEAVALGVPEKEILVEDISVHTLENVLASILVLNRKFHLYNIKSSDECLPDETVALNFKNIYAELDSIHHVSS